MIARCPFRGDTKTSGIRAGAPHPAALITKSALIRELAIVRKAGCAYDREEHVIGMQCVAAPVFNEFGEVVCALSVSGPRVRVDAPTLSSHGQAVIEAAARATDVLGGIQPEYWHHG